MKLGIFAAIVLLIIVVPHIFLWTLNTLFGLHIEHTLLNWFAALVLLALVGSSSRG